MVNMEAYQKAADFLALQLLSSLTLSDLLPVRVQVFALITDRTEIPLSFIGSGQPHLVAVPVTLHQHHYSK